MSWLTEDELRDPSIAVEFDREDALDRMGGDEELLQEVILLYSEDTPIQLEKLVNAIAQTDLGQVYRCAHSIKSASANVGARRASAYAARIEQLGRVDSPNAHHIDELVKLASQLSNSVDYISRVCQVR